MPGRPLTELVDPGWAEALEPVADDVARMGEFLRSEVAAGRGYLPAGENVLRALTRPFDDVRVLIVGQDPYPTPGHAMGLSLLGAPDVRPIPRSLQNIFSELVSDVAVPRPANGDLSPVGRPRRAAAQPGPHGGARQARLAPRQGLGSRDGAGDPRPRRARPTAGGDAVGT